MKRILAFAFFLLFLAAIALVNLKGIEQAEERHDAQPRAAEPAPEDG